MTFKFTWGDRMTEMVKEEQGQGYWNDISAADSLHSDFRSSLGTGLVTMVDDRHQQMDTIYNPDWGSFKSIISI